MEIRQLKYFVAVAELEHFGQAAERLHVVQPALSRQIKQLEEEIGTDLFERLPRGVRLTQAGSYLLQEARALLEKAENIALQTSLIGHGNSGVLRIGFADGATYGSAFANLLRHVRNQLPNVNLKLVPASSLNQALLLERGVIDIGFAYWLPENLEVHSLELATEKLVLAVPKASRLAQHRSVRLRDLHEQPFIWCARNESPMYYDKVLSSCHRAKLTLKVVQEANGENTMLSLVAAGIGATFITESAKRRKPDGVLLLPVEDLNVEIVLKVMWRKCDQTPVLGNFISIARQVTDQNN